MVTKTLVDSRQPKAGGKGRPDYMGLRIVTASVFLIYFAKKPAQPSLTFV